MTLFLPKPGVTKNFQNAIEKRVFNIFQRVRVRLKAEIPYFTIHKEKNGKNFEKNFVAFFPKKVGLSAKFGRNLATNVVF